MKKTFSIILMFSILFFVSCLFAKEKSNKGGTMKQENSLINTILSRKSVRKYSDKKVEQEKIDTILKAAMSAPSGMNKQPWEILVITDKSKLEKIAEIAPNASYSAHSQLAMIVCGNKDISDKFWIQDCSAMSENILLAVEALELGAVWCAVFPFEDKIEAIKNLFGLPENIIPLNIIPIGYPLNDENPKEKYDAKKIHTNNW